MLRESFVANTGHEGNSTKHDHGWRYDVRNFTLAQELELNMTRLTMLNAASKVFFSKYGHRNCLDLTAHFTLEWQMALLDISEDIWYQCTPFRHHPSNDIFTVRSLSEHLPSHDHTSYLVAFSRYIPNDFCHDHKHALFYLCAIVGHVVKLFA